MPRSPRIAPGGLCYHVINRGAGRATVFHQPEDYADFLTLMARACLHVRMRVIAYCLMPNHFHAILWPRNDGDLSRWLHWLLTMHVGGHHRRYRTSGHLWQGRTRTFPIETDRYLLNAHRYVEGNAKRAGLVDRAEDWMWSSVRWIDSERRPFFLVDGPVPRPPHWLALVNQPLGAEEITALRRSVTRGAPLGDPSWAERVARQLKLERALRPRGRPAAQPR